MNIGKMEVDGDESEEDRMVVDLPVEPETVKEREWIWAGYEWGREEWGDERMLQETTTFDIPAPPTPDHDRITSIIDGFQGPEATRDPKENTP